jgi:hypothetical protein
MGLISAMVVLAHELRDWSQVGLALQDDHDHMQNSAVHLFAIAFFAFGIRNRLRSPAVEVSDEAVFFGAVPRMFLPRKRIPVSEIAAVRSTHPRKLELELKSGKRVKIDLFEVTRSERPAVKFAIERRVGQSPA